MDFTWLGIQIWIWGHRYLQKGCGVDQKTSQYQMCSVTSPSHRVDQAVDCVLWNVVPLLFHECAKLLDIGGNWNTLSYTLIQSIPDMLNAWHVWWICRPWKNWDIFSFQELCTDPCDMGPWIIMLKHDGSGWMARQWASGSDHGISVHSNCQ
jgi:hypothetical protein